MVSRQLGEERAIAVSVVNLGNLSLREERFLEARTLCTEALSLFTRLGDERGRAVSLLNLGVARVADGHPLEAAAPLTESLHLLREQENKEMIAFCLLGLAGVAVAAGDGCRAASLLGSAQAVRAEIGASERPYESHVYRRIEQSVRAALDEAAYTVAVEQGRSRSLDGTLDDVLVSSR